MIINHILAMTCTAVKANVYVMFSLMNTRGKKITTEGEIDMIATDRRPKYVPIQCFVKKELRVRHRITK
jgi:hypothetical protein